MNKETVLTFEEIITIGEQASSIEAGLDGYILPFTFARDIEQAILQSPEIQALKRDKERLDWLADPKNNLGIVQLPKDCVWRYPHSLRDGIDEAMEYKDD